MVIDIPAGDGKIANLFYNVKEMFKYPANAPSYSTLVHLAIFTEAAKIQHRLFTMVTYSNNLTL